MVETAELDLYKRLSELLRPEEVQDLVDSIEAVINYRNGYGHISVEIERRRVIQIAITSTVKPGVI